MSQKVKQLQRSDVDEKHKWNEFVNYSSNEEWEKDYSTLDDMISGILELKGKLGENVQNVIEFFRLQELLNIKTSKLEVHADVHKYQDLRVGEAQARVSKLSDKISSLSALTSFIRPELLSLSLEKLEEYRAAPQMKEWSRNFDEIVRYKPHTLSEKEEAILSSVDPALEVSQKTYEYLTDADMQFGVLKDETGKEVLLTHGLYSRLIRSFNREVRKNAFESMYSSYTTYTNTICSTLDGHVKAEIFRARARHFPSSLERSLFTDNISVAVYDSLISAIHDGLPAFHRYLSIRQRVLSLPVLDMYDMYVPLVADYKVDVAYEQAVEWVLTAVEPLGPEYVEIATRALKTERWVDVYETEGKRSGACSIRNFRSVPYLLLNYSGTLDDVFTLAHELGHSIHNYLSSRAQPYRTYNYSVAVSEVASTLNEALLFFHLLEKARTEKNTRLETYLINMRCDDFKGTIIRQTQFAEFEKEFFAMAKRGEPLTPASLSKLYKGINDVYYGDTHLLSSSSSSSSSSISTSTPPHTLSAHPQIAWEFLRIPHFFYFFYVYKYATSMSVSDVLAQRIYDEYKAESGGKGKKKQLEKYFRMLKAGGSKDALDILCDVGVDLRTPQPFADAMAHFGALVAQLDVLLLGKASM